MAIREVRRADHRIFGSTADREAHACLPLPARTGAHAMLPYPARLPFARPTIHRQITS